MGIETVDIRPAPQSLERLITLYESMNDVGKARFILTIPEEDRETFLTAYEKHYHAKGAA